MSFTSPSSAFADAFADLPLLDSEPVPPRIAAALDALRAGRAVVLQDDHDRENEADLIVAAERITPETMALLIRECSGIVCLCLTDEKVRALELPPMVQTNESRNGTAFTVSIEAREGVHTGVSAADRVTTIRAAIADGTATVETVTDPETGETVTTVTARTPKPEGDEPDPDAEATEAEEDDKEKPVTAAAKAPQDLKASATRSKTKTPGDAFQLIAQSFNTQDDAPLHAALADITVGAATTGIFGKVNNATWLGQLWSGRDYVRKFVPLIGAGTITGMKVVGWRFVQKPVMADYAGNKAAIPSNTVTVESAEALAQRLAGGHDIDRAYFDLGSSEFVEAYLKAMTDSYAELSDGKAIAAIVAAATANPTTAGTVPAGVSEGMAAIVDGALDVLNAKATPTFAIVGSNLYRDVLLTRNDDALTYLNASLGLEDGSIASFKVVPGGSDLDADSVVVGAKQAVTFYELGSTPIRVQAENIPNGGRDIGCFGYYSSIVNKADAITLVDTAPV